MPATRPDPRSRWQSRRWAAAPAGAAASTLIALATLSGCAASIHVVPAPDAANPVCASVVLALPQSLAGLHRISTTSQGTAAWGDTTTSVVLRCGVTPLGPTTDPCVTITDAAGTSVDWVVTANGSRAGGSWTFVTYGRTPSVELTIPQALAAEQPDTILMEVGQAADVVPPTRACT
ncbi:MAG: DUF3515 family protein [Cellulomonas sp.]